MVLLGTSVVSGYRSDRLGILSPFTPSHGERYGGRNSVGNGTKRLQNGSIRAVFPLFCRRNPSSLITGRFFLEAMAVG